MVRGIVTSRMGDVMDSSLTRRADADWTDKRHGELGASPSGAVKHSTSACTVRLALSLAWMHVDASLSIGEPTVWYTTATNSPQCEKHPTAGAGGLVAFRPRPPCFVAHTFQAGIVF